MSAPQGPERVPERLPHVAGPEFGDPDFDNDPVAPTPRPSQAFEGESRDAVPQTPMGRGLGKMVLAGAALFVAVLLGLSTIGSPKPAGDETVHANWASHVQPVTQYNESENTGAPVVRRVGSGGTVEYTTTVGVSGADLDGGTTAAVQDAIANRDPSAINAAVVAAQQIPELEPAQQEIVAQKLSGPAPTPSISSGMQDAVRSGDAKFYHIYLFDSCDEDGDIVEVLLDGEPFALVPITHQGATLSVPIVTGSSTTISLRGVHDGEGGITVACRTSQGDFFVSRMLEGQVQVVSATP